ncbi:hypothetical protein KBX39_31825, partial [Micromonospora sp. D75]|nr:hypothetical protein [Micromonospora sp. D75]
MKSAVPLLVLALATATLPACGDDPAPAPAADPGSPAGPAAAPSATPSGRSGLGSARSSPTPA